MCYKSTRVRCKLLFIAVFVSLLAFVPAGTSLAQEEPAGEPSADNGLPPFPLLESESFAKADFDKLFEEAASFIKNHPDSHHAELLMQLLSQYKGRASNYDIFEPVLEEILQKDLKNGFNEEMYREELARFYRRRGLEEKAASTRTFDGYILDCLILGPFGNSYGACLEVPYKPEKDLLEGQMWPDLVKKEYVGSDEFRKIKWMKYPYEKPVRSPHVSPFTYLRPSGGCAYILIQVKSAGERPVIIDVNAGRLFKLWLNKNLALHVDDKKKREPESHLVAVNLVEGWNQILLKVPGGSFKLALRDTGGHLVRDLVLETGLVIHPVEAKGPLLYDGEFNGGALKYYEKLVKENAGNAKARVAYSFALDGHGLDVQALEEAQAALDIEPDNLFIAYFTSTRYLNAPHYPRALARNKAKEIWDRIVEANPGFVLAHEKIAGYLTDDDKHEDAVKLLGEKILAKGLDNLGTQKLLLGIYNSKKWEREKIAQFKKIEKLTPDTEWVYNWWAEYYSDLKNPEKAWEFTTRAYELNKSGVWYLNRKARRLERRGRLDEALQIYLEIMKLRPDNYWTIYNIADIYLKQGRFAEVIAQRKKLMEMRPEDADDYEAIGDIYLQWGKKPEALENYDKSLILEPGQWELRRYVQFLRGGDEDFSKPYALPDEEVMKLVKSAPGKEAYPKASNLKVLDEEITKILPDGSKASYVHRIYKILDISGKDRHSTPYVGGEMIEVRTIQPDGKILEPTSVYGSFTMPSLKEGVCIEYKYRTDSGWGRSRRADFESERWFFQDEGYDEPVMNCRRVVIMSRKPSDQETLDFLAKFGRQPWCILDFCELKQNKVGPELGTVDSSGVVKPLVEFHKEEIGDTIVYSWSTENMPRIEREPYMPGRDETLPNAYFISHRSWSDFAENLKERTFTSGDIPTRLVREKALEIAGGITGQFEQVKTLYEWCMNEIKGGWGSGEAHAVLLEKSGNRDTLFASFLNVLEIPFDIVLVGPDPYSEPDIEWEIPRAHYFRGSLMRVKPAGHEPLFVSLDTRYLPLGKIPESYQGGPLYTAEGGITGKSLPREPLDDIADKQLFNVNLVPLTCDAKLSFPNARSYGRKESYKDMPVPELKQMVERQANNYFPGAVVKDYDLPELKQVGRMFRINFTCEVPNFLTVKKDGTFVAKTGIDPLEMQQRYADKATREFTMVLRSENLARTSVTIELGQKYEIAQLPTSVNLRNDFGTYVLTFSLDGSLLTIKRRFTLLPQRIETDRYEDFLEFCRKIDEAERSVSSILAPAGRPQVITWIVSRSSTSIAIRNAV